MLSDYLISIINIQKKSPMNKYETPEVIVLDLEIEGVLCGSGQIERWEGEDLNWYDVKL